MSLSIKQKQHKLRLARQHLSQVVSFLAPYLPLANAHNSDFILCDHWNSFIPAPIAHELLSLNDAELSLLPSGKLFEAYVRLSTQSDSGQNSEQLCKNVCGQLISDAPDADDANVEERTEVCRDNSEEADTGNVPMHGLLNIVDSDVVHLHSIDQQVADCVDLVSARKPLAAQCDSNFDRSLIPTWTHNSLKEFVSSAASHHICQSVFITPLEEFQRDVGITLEMDRIVVSTFMKTKKSYEVDIMTGLCSAIAQKYSLKTIVDVGSGRGYLGCHLSLMHGLRVIGVDASSGNTASALHRTHLLHKQWQGLTKKARNQKISAKVNGATTQKNVSSQPSEGDERASSHSLFKSVTVFVSPATNLSELVSQHWPSSEQQQSTETFVVSALPEQLMLTGLHTCGDLSASILRLYSKNSSAAVVCQIGCCYNLLNERFFHGTNEFRTGCVGLESCSEPGFPMSSLLIQEGYGLGRNARMIACQSPERSASKLELPSESVYWRSLLQVVLRDTVGYVRDDWCVGKISAKCRSFEEYCRKAFNVLGIANEVSDEKLTEYRARYSDMMRKNIAFFQLKTVLGPCIESLILLDRLVYLLEQDDVEDAYIVPVFDAVVSPRRFAVFSVKCRK